MQKNRDKGSKSYNKQTSISYEKNRLQGNSSKEGTVFYLIHFISRIFKSTKITFWDY